MAAVSLCNIKLGKYLKPMLSVWYINQVQLGKFFGIRDFSKEVRKCREALVSASIAVYIEMCQRMMPTPAKYHYTFNLRDLSKVRHTHSHWFLFFHCLLLLCVFKIVYITVRLHRITDLQIALLNPILDSNKQ